MIDPSNTDIILIPATTLELPVADMNVFESHEGMYVNVVAAGGDGDNIIFSEYYNFDTYGDAVVCKARNRLFQFTERNVPDIDVLMAIQHTLTKLKGVASSLTTIMEVKTLIQLF